MRFALGRHAEARKHLKDIIDESWGGSDVRVKHAFEQADFDLRRTKRLDYYALLNCRQVSSEREIKGAYHAQSLLHHPDRHATASPEVQKAEAEVFKRLGEALTFWATPRSANSTTRAIHKEAAKRTPSGSGGGGCEAAKRASNYFTTIVVFREVHASRRSIKRVSTAAAAPLARRGESLIFTRALLAPDPSQRTAKILTQEN